MKRMKINIVGIREVRWQDARKITSGTFEIFYRQTTLTDIGPSTKLAQSRNSDRNTVSDERKRCLEGHDRLSLL